MGVALPTLAVLCLSCSAAASDRSRQCLTRNIHRAMSNADEGIVEHGPIWCHSKRGQVLSLAGQPITQIARRGPITGTMAGGTNAAMHTIALRLQLRLRLRLRLRLLLPLPLRPHHLLLLIAHAAPTKRQP
jgi:hypothetical protein